MRCFVCLFVMVSLLSIPPAQNKRRLEQGKSEKERKGGVVVILKISK